MSQEPAPYGVLTAETSWARLAVIFSDIAAERARQEALKRSGRFRWTLADADMPDADRLAALGEEYGEVCRALLEAHGEVADVHGKELRKELIQVAAVVVAWVERLDRDSDSGSS